MDEPTTGEGTAEQQNTGNSAGLAQIETSNHSHSAYRDHIVDRTGELMNSAFHQAEQHMRANAAMIKDPRDGTPAHFVITNHGVHALDPASFDGYRQYPLARKGTVRLTTLDSFIEVVRRFAFPTSAIFACDDMAKPSLTAIFDYHPANEMAEGEDVPPMIQNGHHRASYAFPLSPEWQAWIGMDAKPMGMVEFARFLEDHIVDVSADPLESFGAASQAFVKANRGNLATPTKLIEISRGLQIYESSVIKEAKNLSTGEAQFTFDSQHTDGDGKPLVLPNMFSIVLPVFRGASDPFRLVARFRYRKTNEGLKFWYELWRPDLVFDTAFQESLAEVSSETELPVYIGAPEL